MDKINVTITYLTDDNIEAKEMQLTKIELIGLMLSNKMGPEGEYFNIKDKIFKDTKDGYSVTVVLENADEKKTKPPLPWIGQIGGIKKN